MGAAIGVGCAITIGISFAPGVDRTLGPCMGCVLGLDYAITLGLACTTAFGSCAVALGFGSCAFGLRSCAIALGLGPGCAIALGLCAIGLGSCAIGLGLCVTDTTDAVTALASFGTYSAARTARR